MVSINDEAGNCVGIEWSSIGDPGIVLRIHGAEQRMLDTSRLGPIVVRLDPVDAHTLAEHIQELLYSNRPKES